MTSLFTPTRFPFLFLLAAALLSSCAKEAGIAPAPGPAPARTAALANAQTTSQNSTTSPLAMSSRGNAFAPGRNLNFIWSTGLPPGQQPGPEVATRVTVEFQRNGSTVVRALDQPVTVFSDRYYTHLLVPYSIPSMLDAGTYTIVVHPSDPTKSLLPASSSQAYVTTLQDNLPVTANPFTIPGEPLMQMRYGQHFTTNISFRWLSQDLQAGAIRVYLVDSTGLIYDPGLYSQRPLSPAEPLGYTDNDGAESQNISVLPAGEYSVVLGSVDITYDNPAAAHMPAGVVDIDAPVVIGPGTGPGPQ